MALIVDVSTLILIEMKLLQGSDCTNKIPLQLMVPPHLALVLLVLVALGSRRLCNASRKMVLVLITGESMMRCHYYERVRLQRDRPSVR